MADRKPLPGKFVWYELITYDVKQAQAFYRKVLGWRVHPFPMGNTTYDMILTGDAPDSMIGGYVPSRGEQEPSRWVSYVSVEDVDASARAAAANGGKVIKGPLDIPNVGRTAAIADPEGAEMNVMKNSVGDPADAPATHGQFLWNELHTTDARKALAFYEKVVGYTHRSLDMGPGGVYHVIGMGGVDRGGVMEHLPAGARPHWLPYVNVDDPDAVIARAKIADGRILVPPQDIPEVGRFGVVEDPTGGMLAVMKPMPMPSEKAAEKPATRQRA